MYLAVVAAVAGLALGTKSTVTMWATLAAGLGALLWVSHLIAYSFRSTRQAIEQGMVERRMAVRHLIKSVVVVGAITALPVAWAQTFKCPEGSHACGTKEGKWCCMNGYGCCNKKPHCASAGMRCP